MNVSRHRVCVATWPGGGCDRENVTTQAAEVKFKSTRIHFIDFIISLLWYGG